MSEPGDADPVAPVDRERARQKRRRELEEREQRPLTQEELWDMGEDVPCPPSRMRPSAPST